MNAMEITFLVLAVPFGVVLYAAFLMSLISLTKVLWEITTR